MIIGTVHFKNKILNCGVTSFRMLSTVLVYTVTMILQSAGLHSYYDTAKCWSTQLPSYCKVLVYTVTMILQSAGLHSYHHTAKCWSTQLL